jgi:ubiquinone biosynthesis protein
MGLAFNNRLKMPSDLVLVFKAIAMLEGISLQLDPNINVFDEVEPYVREALLELQSPVNRLKAIAEMFQGSAEAMLLLPKQLQRILEQVEGGEADLSMKLKGLDEPVRRIESAANRLVLAILAVAFVLGPALLIPRLHELFGELQAGAYFLIIAGFAASLILTFILLVGIWRSRR